MERRRMWTAAEDAVLIATDGKLTPAQQAEQLGRSRHGVLQRRSHLGKIGKLPARNRYTDRPWTSWQEAKLLDAISAGYTTAQIARQLGRTTESVRVRAWRVAGGVQAVRSDLLAVRSGHAIARLFGVRKDLPYIWIAQGWLTARRDPKPRKSRHKPQYLITDQALHTFLSRREAWPAWSPATMTDPDWRGEAEEIRAAAGGCWIAASEWARQRYYDPGTICGWIKDGRIPAISYGRRWYVWSTDAAQFVPPLERRRAA